MCVKRKSLLSIRRTAQFRQSPLAVTSFRYCRQGLFQPCPASKRMEACEKTILISQHVTILLYFRIFILKFSFVWDDDVSAILCTQADIVWIKIAQFCAQTGAAFFQTASSRSRGQSPAWLWMELSRRCLKFPLPNIENVSVSYCPDGELVISNLNKFE